MVHVPASADRSEPPPVVRACTAADVALLTSREPVGKAYASTTYERQREGLCVYLVAWVADEPVGSAELEPGDPPEVKNVTVSRSWRGRGIGSRLLDAAEGLAAVHGAVRLGVATDNPDAARFYLRRGYRATGAREVTTYAYVDDDGAVRIATEENEDMVKVLNQQDEGGIR